ncbi:hypothetical protein BgiMline_031450, partial [Biomphalaria glabrata]
MIKVTVCRVFVAVLFFSRNNFAFQLEVKKFTIHSLFKHVLTEDLEVVWLVNGNTVSQCSLKGGCLDDFRDKTNTSLSYNQETGFVSCNVTINNVTRDHFGDWSLKYLGVAGLVYKKNVFECRLYDDQSKQEGGHVGSTKDCNWDGVKPQTSNHFFAIILAIVPLVSFVVLSLITILLYKNCTC